MLVRLALPGGRQGVSASPYDQGRFNPMHSISGHAMTIFLIKIYLFKKSFFLATPMADGSSSAGIESKPQLQLMPMLQPRQTLNPLCWAGDGA